ncbi:hypothetical protein M080_1158, partial [Bacteroides fragilis str. 3397 T10]
MLFKAYLRVISFAHHNFLAFGNGKKHFIFAVLFNV